jgi:heme exporter protein C
MARALSLITLRRLAIATVAVLAAGYALAFFYAPEDADQGFIQKIFYLHVPLATVALLGFMVAAVHAIRHLRTGDPIHDARAYVSIHISVIFGLAVPSPGRSGRRAHGESGGSGTSRPWSAS